MPDFILHENAVIMCKHGGQVKHVVVVPQVKVSNNAIVVQPNPHVVTGCPLPPTPPCVQAIWTSAATKVTSFGQPVLLKSSKATCPAPGTGVDIITTQIRAKAT